MSEAENEAVEVEQPEVEQVAEQEPQAGTAPADSEAQPVVDEAEAERKRINEAFAKKQAKIAKERTGREEAEARAKAAEEKLAKFEQAPVGIPNMPDPLDFDTDAEFQQKVRERDEAIRQAAIRDGFVKASQEREQQAQAEAERARQEAANQKGQAFVERAKALEVKPEDLQKASQTIVQFGVTDDFVDYIATHEEGPLLAVYLAANPMDLDSLSRMSPMQQAIQIENSIRPKASALKPKPSQAPDPATALGGNGARPRQRGTDGAVFE